MAREELSQRWPQAWHREWPRSQVSHGPFEAWLSRQRSQGEVGAFLPFPEISAQKGQPAKVGPDAKLEVARGSRHLAQRSPVWGNLLGLARRSPSKSHRLRALLPLSIAGAFQTLVCSGLLATVLHHPRPVRPRPLAQREERVP